MTPIAVLRHDPYSMIATFPDGLSCRWEEQVDQEWEPYHGDLRRNSVPFAHLERRSNGTWWVAPATTGRFGGKATWRPVDMQLLRVPTDAGIVDAVEAAIELLSDPALLNAEGPGAPPPSPSSIQS